MVQLLYGSTMSLVIKFDLLSIKMLIIRTKNSALKYRENVNILKLQDKDVTGAVLREVVNHCKQTKLEKFEVPGSSSHFCTGDRNHINYYSLN